MVQEMSFKDISYLQFWGPFCSVKGNHLCNFGRRHYGEHSCEIILNLDQWFKRCLLKICFILALPTILFGKAEPFVQFW